MSVSFARLAFAAGLLFAFARPAQALLDPCSFNFGMHWDKGPSFPDEVGYVTIWTNQGFDDGYHGGMLNGLKNTTKTPVFYGYLIAKTSGLRDCDVSTAANLCTDGANYIRNNMPKILQAYGSFAQSAERIWGKERQIVFMIEPDFYQYFQTGVQNGGSLPFDSAGVIMGKIHDKVREFLPQAEFSFDISPWVSQKSWYARFDTTSFTWANTSGGRTQGGAARIREENGLTWASAATTLNRGIIADVGYGVGGGPDQTGIDAWNVLANLNARIADGVVAITNSLADNSWGNTLRTLRPQLSTNLKSCREAGPRVSKFALTTNVVGSGAVARDVTSGTYDSNKVVRLAARPSVGYRFVSWSGAATGTTPVASVTMNKAQTVTATFELTPQGPPQGTGSNLVRNGDFAAGPADWSLAVNCGAATGSVESGAYVVRVTDAGNAGYCLQFRQTGMNLESGKTYQFSFDAKTESPRTVIGYVGQDGAPYTNYLLGTTGDWSVSATSTSQTFTKSFTMGSADPTARIDINLGGAGTGAVTIDNVSLRSGRTLPQYTVTATLSGKLAANKIVKVPDQPTYDSGSTVALFAFPDSTSSFGAWAGATASSAASAIVFVDGNKTLTANFGSTSVRLRASRPSALRQVGDRLEVDAGAGVVSVTLRTPSGTLVRELHSGATQGALSLPLSADLPRGLYLATLDRSGESSSLRVLLSK
jgi:hypothetical protein